MGGQARRKGREADFVENRCSDAMREDRVLEERVERSKTDEESSSERGREFLAATYEVLFLVLAGIRHRELWSNGSVQTRLMIKRGG